MLTRLRFKNWRSLKDVDIDLTPITVFIGANSSGKTNILDGLYFLRNVIAEGETESLYRWGGDQQIRTIGTDVNQSIEIEFSVLVNINNEHLPIMSKLELKPDSPFRIAQLPGENIQFVKDLSRRLIQNIPRHLLDIPGYYATTVKYIDTFIEQRLQMLDENFMPPLSVDTPKRQTLDLYTVDRCADNLVFMLDFMRQTQPDLYDELMADFAWLLGHVDSVTTERTDYETRVLLREKSHPEIEAPTVSSGTARALAMLTAFYALDMRYKEMPGLVVIEEPDTALNPGLLERFVEQLRSYVDREHPRQVILTTHNPTLLNLFEPEEVRVVERDEQGYTSVHTIPERVREIWLDEYGLGEVWTTRSLGGVPE